MTIPYDIDDEEEDAPLLSDLRPAHIRSPSSSTLPFYQTRSRRIITLIIFAIIFIMAFGGTLMAVPSIRLYEDIICHHFYNGLKGEDHIGLGEEIEEGLCKRDEVQEQLNILFAGLHFLGALPSLITAVPYGLLADRIGRRPVLVLSMMGIFLANLWSLAVMWFWRHIPVRMLWLTPLFILIGGGETVGSMLFYAIGFDVTPQAKRANVFLIGGGMPLFAEIVAPSLAALLMAKSPWIPLIMGLSGFLIGPCLLIFVPETLHLRPRETESAILTPDNASERSVSTSDESDQQGFFTTITKQASNGLKEAYGSLSVLHSLPILLLLIPFVMQPLIRQSVDLSIRYISNRFHWKLRQASYLLSLRAFINFTLLLALLPGLSWYLIKRLHFSSTEKDLFLVRFSVIVLVLGALLIGISPTIIGTIIGMIIFTLGTGTGALTRSLITSLVDQEHVGRLYAAIGLVETCGSLAAGPMLAGLYTLGLQLQGPWVGLPFLAVAIICSVGGVGIWGFGCLSRRFPRERVPSTEEEEGDESALLILPDFAEGGAINVV